MGLLPVHQVDKHYYFFFFFFAMIQLNILLEMLLDLFEHLFGRLGGVDLNHLAVLAEVLDDGHGGVEVGVEPLLQRLEVVVGAAGAGGAAVQAPLDARLLVAHEEQDKVEVGLVPHLLVPAAQVVLVAREAVDEELVRAGLVHGALEQRAGDLDGDDGAVGDVALDQLAELGSGLFPLLA